MDYLVVKLLGIFVAGISLQLFLEYALRQALKAQEKRGQQPDPLITKVLFKILKLALWIGVGIVLLQNLGVNVSAIVGGLGIGGIAVAFALKEILADILAYFSIQFDKPFQEGDSIVIGDDRGTVKHIGLKSTRLQSVQGEELIIPNQDLTGSRLRNFKKMGKRRVVFGFGVAYETPTKKIKKIPGIIKNIFAGRKLAELDRVHFKELGDFSLNFEVVYHFKGRNYRAYLGSQQAINLAILEEFEREGIQLAYPTQKVFISKT